MRRRVRRGRLYNIKRKKREKVKALAHEYCIEGLKRGGGGKGTATWRHYTELQSEKEKRESAGQHGTKTPGRKGGGREDSIRRVERLFGGTRGKRGENGFVQQRNLGEKKKKKKKGDTA